MAVLSPASRKQELFINSTSTITVFGGAAGSGKSYTGLMDLLKWVHDPLFRGVIFRRTTPQITGVGGMFDEANIMFNDVLMDAKQDAIKAGHKIKEADYKLRVSNKDLKMVFPSKAEIKFRHMEHIKDKYNIQGWQISEALVDEATQFEEEQIMYIISRLRTKAKMNSHLKMTCNPDADSFLRVWLDDAGYLSKDGLPLEHRAGVEVVCGQINGKMQFRDTLELWREEFPKSTPMTFCFIPATCKDNPVLLQNEPDYLSKLENLPRIDRARLLEGNWFVREQSSGMFLREWCGKPIPMYEVPTKVTLARAWDKAASLPSEVYPDPDYTVGLKLAKDSEGILYVMDMVRFRGRPAKVQETIENTAEYDGRYCTITIPQDAGAAGVMESQQSASKLFEKGFTCKIKKSNNAGKGVRFKPVSAYAENGMIKVVAGDWNDDFFNELEQFTGESKSKHHDDVPDAFSDAVEELTTGRVLPTFTMPNLKTLTRDNPYKL